MLSSLSLQAAALQSRSQVLAGQRLRQAEDALMSAAQHLLADPRGVEQLASRLGEAGQVGPVAYRLVSLAGPSWQTSAEPGAAQRGQAVVTLELLASAEQPQALQAAFALELMRLPAPEAGVSPDDVSPDPVAPVQLVALRELGLRGRSAAVGAP